MQVSRCHGTRIDDVAVHVTQYILSCCAPLALFSGGQGAKTQLLISSFSPHFHLHSSLSTHRHPLTPASPGGADRLHIWQSGWAKEGFFRWKVKVAGEDREVHIRPEHVEKFTQIPIAEYVARFPVESDW